MRYSQFYAPTKKSVAKSESINAYLLDKAGFVRQMVAGAYVMLPLAVRSLQKIEQVVREEMNAIGGNETIFTALQPKATWEKSGRWNDPNFQQIIYIDTDAGMTFGATHEEPMAIVVKESVQSYRDLPILLYQFQAKFRKELRAKSGLLRGREFRMKDLYSFHATPEDHHKFYELAADAYIKVFKRLGLDAYRTKASGGVFSDEYSDEFQVICQTGEDEILVDRQKKTGYNKEVEDQIDEVEKKKLERVRSIEVGNIFHLGTKYTDAFDVKFSDENGEKRSIYMGSYGIGISRLLGTLAEIYNDEYGLKLPRSVAPFDLELIDLAASKEGEDLYEKLTKAGYDVLFDDRAMPAGQKLIDADLLGMPIRLVYSNKTAEHESVEVKVRATGDVELVKLASITDKIGKLLS